MLKTIEELYDGLVQYYYPIQNKYSYVSLGGSIPLIITNTIPFRPVKDIDIISTQFISKAEIKYEVFGCGLYELDDQPFDIGRYKTICNKPLTQDLGLDLFINPQATYYYIKYRDLKLRISPPEEIFQFKFKRGLQSSHQTKQDLKEFLAVL